MKIYCILCDAAPLTKGISSLAENTSSKILSKISNSFTLTSVMSMLTGKMPSDIKEEGIGWYSASKEVVAAKEQPWIEDVIFEKMPEWDVCYQNATYVYQLLYGDDRIEQCSAYPGGIEVEKVSGWDDIHSVMIGSGEDTESFYEREKSFINRVQAKKSDKDQFYFVLYHQVHSSYSSGKNTQEALSRTEELLSYWDFYEEDSLFIVFSDHGDFRKIDSWCSSPHAWLTWALIKDNTSFDNTSVNKSLVSITDLYDLISSKVFRCTSESISSTQDKDRIYFTEDGRAHINKYRSTTASAIKATAWSDDDKPLELLQVVYHQPANRFRMFGHNLYSGLTTEYNTLDKELKDSLIDRFQWVPE